MVALNEEETLIFTADKFEQKCFSVRTCALINSVELPDNLGTPTQLIVLRGGLYSVVCSNTGLVCVVNLL